MAELTFRIQVAEDGSITENYGSRAFRNQLKDFAGEDCKLTIGKWRKARSLPQNAYYHGCVINAVIDGLVDIGYPKHELSHEIVHDMLKEKFLKKEIISEQTGEVITVGQSTSRLSTVQFMEYLADIQQWANEFLGIVIADPEQQAILEL